MIRRRETGLPWGIARCKGTNQFLLATPPRRKDREESRLGVLRVFAVKPYAYRYGLGQNTDRSQSRFHAGLIEWLDRLADAAARGADVVCLQELFHGRYPCQTEDHARFKEAEPIPGPTSVA